MRKSFRGILLTTLFGLLATLGISDTSSANAAVIGAYNIRLVGATAYTHQSNTCALDLSFGTKLTGEVYKFQWRVAYSTAVRSRVESIRPAHGNQLARGAAYAPRATQLFAPLFNRGVLFFVDVL